MEIVPMQFEWVDVDAAERLIESDDWVAQQKVDGVRCMVHLTDGQVQFMAADGSELRHAASALHFESLFDSLAVFAQTGDWVLDGELMADGKYIVFDLPYYRVGENEQGPEATQAERRDALVRVWEVLGDEVAPQVVLMPESRSAHDKAALFDLVRDAGAEGLCFKLKHARYECGKRVKTVLKVKFTKTADCVVTARNVGGTNAHLAMYEGGELVPVGRCSMIGKPDAQPGDVVEIKFLYATESLSLYQPTLLRIREDKEPVDCLLGQLTPALVNRELVA